MFNSTKCFDSHMHTPLCGHALGMPRSYIDQAVERQIGLLTFTCHIPIDREDFGGIGIRMRENQLDEYIALIDDARVYGEGLGVEVLTGIEAEYFPNDAIMADIKSTLARYPFDFILGSLHHMLPSYRSYLDDMGCFDNKKIVSQYFKDLESAARLGIYHSLSHPDVIRLYGTLPEPFNPLDHEEAITSFLDVVKASGICLEINTSGLTKGDYVVHPDPIIMDWAITRNIPFTMGSDSHQPTSVGQFFDDIYQVVKNKGLHELQYFKKGKRHSVAIKDLIAIRV